MERERQRDRQREREGRMNGKRKKDRCIISPQDSKRIALSHFLLPYKSTYDLSNISARLCLHHCPCFTLTCPVQSNSPVTHRTSHHGVACTSSPLFSSLLFSSFEMNSAPRHQPLLYVCVPHPVVSAHVPSLHCISLHFPALHYATLLHTSLHFSHLSFQQCSQTYLC